MEYLPALDPRTYTRLTPAALRREFVQQGLFAPGRLVLRHWETDRTLIGGVVPLRKKLELPPLTEFVSTFFCERREVGVINLGGPGVVTVDGRKFSLGRLDGLYIGRGARRVGFTSRRAAEPAQFYLLSYPAHAAHPTTLIPHASVTGIVLGTNEGANSRVLYRYICPGSVASCQLVMGLTLIQPGSKWNTMPPHTHLRRSEVYFYFGLPPRGRVTHYLGHPKGIRKVALRAGEAVLSPPWSIHCGVGTTHYGFVWGMGGENQVFADMDPVDPALIR